VTGAGESAAFNDKSKVVSQNAESVSYISNKSTSGASGATVSENKSIPIITTNQTHLSSSGKVPSLGHMKGANSTTVDKIEVAGNIVSGADSFRSLSSFGDSEPSSCRVPISSLGQERGGRIDKDQSVTDAASKNNKTTFGRGASDSGDNKMFRLYFERSW
jgi:hypothetical protein